MFPNIGNKSKKKAVLGTPEMVQEWAQTKKQLQVRAKAASPKITSPCIADFLKICRLKEIPDFYSNYLFLFLAKATEEKATEILEREIRQAISHKSHHHLIQQSIEERVTLLAQTSQVLQIVEGFQAMNAGHSVSSSTKAKINELLQDATSLQAIKEVEERKMKELAQCISSLRKGLKKLLGAVTSWQDMLSNICDLGSLKRQKIIYPYQGINCLLVPLFDQEFIRQSFLHKQFSIPPDNPFLILGKQTKKKGYLHQIFVDELTSTDQSFDAEAKAILALIPDQKAEEEARLKEKQAKQKEREKINELKNLKMKEMKESKQNKKRKPSSSRKIIDIDSIGNRKAKRSGSADAEHPSNKQALEGGAATERAGKSIGKAYQTNKKIQAMMSQKKDLERQLQQAKKQNKEYEKILNKSNSIVEQQLPSGIEKERKKDFHNKVQAVYQNRRLKPTNVKDKSSHLDIDSIINEKLNLESQLKQQINQKKKLENFVKKTEKEMMKQRQRQKLIKEQHQKELTQFKSQVEQKRELQLSASPKVNKQTSVKEVYSVKPHKKQTYGRSVQSRLQSERSHRKSLEGEISELKKQNANLSRSLSASRSQEASPVLAKDDSEILDLKSSRDNLERQLKEQMREKKQLQKMLKKQEKALLKQNELSEKQKHHFSQEIELLKSKVSQHKSSSPQKGKSNHKVSKSVLEVYANKRESNPKEDLFASKLEEQRSSRANLQKQIKQLMKEKARLVKVIEKSEGAITKEKEMNERRVEKYESAIQKLKQEKEQSRQKIKSQAAEATPSSKQLRMYTTSPIKERKDETKKSADKHAKSMNFFKLPPEMKKLAASKKAPPLVKIEEEDNRPVAKKQLQDIKIIQTKKTIEIVYESNRRSKKQLNKIDNPSQKSQRLSARPSEEKAELEIVKKQKQILLHQLERAEMKKKAQQKANERKERKEDSQIQKFKSIIEQERSKKMELELKMKELKRQLYDEFEEKLKNEKLKFQNERRELLAKIENQKEEKLLKEKYLSNQVKFLREMEANENQLIKLLEAEKRNRMEKERELAEEIAKKEELLSAMEIEEIKKGIEQQVRRELDEDESSEHESEDLNDKKARLEEEIKQMNEERNLELQEIDDQNEKLKKLIQRIKDEENKLVMAIKENIEDSQEASEAVMTELQGRQVTEQNRQTDQQGVQPSDQQQYESKKETKSRIEDKRVDKVNLEEVDRIFKSRMRTQQKQEKQLLKEYKKISDSPEYRDREEVEHLIQKYLQNPHKYPEVKDYSYSPEERHQMAEDMLNKSRLASDFEKELMQLKNVQSFVPTSEDDMLTSHLLSLKRVYQHQQASALRDELFPHMEMEEEDNEQDSLSYESEEFQPKTLRDHVEVHSKKFSSKRKDNKNFLAINRMRVALLEEERKDKEKQMIEDEAKRRAEMHSLKKKLREREQRKKEAALAKKLEEVKMKMAQRESKEARKKAKQMKKKGEGSESEKSMLSEEASPEKEPKKIPSREFEEIRETRREDEVPFNTLEGSEKEDKQSEGSADERDELIRKNDFEGQQDEEYANGEYEQEEQQEREQSKKEEGEGKTYKTEDLQVENEHSSLKRQRQLLQEQIHSYQDEIRSYINGEQQFEIYQQYVESTEIEGYLKQLLDISSREVQLLNGNSTLIKDINSYRSVLILIAKDPDNSTEIGIGIFHKQFEEGTYIGDYILTHNMRHFLNLIFNFSRYIFTLDRTTNRMEFYFDLNKVEDELAIAHFIEFEERCRRLGEVYVKIEASKHRKYVLRRNMFEAVEGEEQAEGQGVRFEVKVRVHEDLMRERNYGFDNKKKLEYISINPLLGDYLRRNEDRLNIFRKNAEEDLRYRELLLTTLMFQKKNVEIKNLSESEMTTHDKLLLMKQLFPMFTIEDNTHLVATNRFLLEHSLAASTKRCTFQVEEEEVNYVIHFPEDPITKIQSSNSSQMGVFMGLIPKYKLLLLDATQFMKMNEGNPEVSVFFYVKHFIKNITEVTKESHPRVFIPEFREHNQAYFSDLSSQMKASVFGEEDISFGWPNPLSNSIVFSPSHRDLVIRKPLIFALLSAAVERAIEGTPISATLIL